MDDSTSTETVVGGPVEEALDAIGDAQRDVAAAKAAVRRRQDQLVTVLRDEFAARRDQGSGVDGVRRLVHSLYWEHTSVRVADLTAATGLDRDALRRFAGPRIVVEPCGRCGAACDVAQTDRGRVPRALCVDCRSATDRGADLSAVGRIPLGAHDDW